MRALRYLLFGLLAVVILIAAAVLFVGSSNERTFALVKQLVAWSTPYALELRAPAVSWSPFALRADLILLRYADPNSPPLASVQSLDYSAPLAQLLSGELRTGTLRANNVSYFLDDEKTDEPIDLESLLLPLSLLPADVQIDSVHFMEQREELWIFPLLGVRAERTADGSMRATATADFAGSPAELVAQSDWRALPGGGHRLDLDARLSGDDAQSGLRLKGRAEAFGPELRYEFDLGGEYARASDFVAAFDPKAYRFAGRLAVEGELSGDLQDFKLLIRNLTLTTDDAYTFSASGEVSQAGDEATQIDIEATGEAQQLDALLPLPEILTQTLERSELRLSVAGTLERPRLQQTGVRLYAAGGTQLELFSESTELALAALQDLSLEQAVELGIRLRSDDLLTFLKAMGTDLQQPHELAAQAEGTLRGTRNELTIDVQSATVEHSAYRATLTAGLLWRQELLSAPRLAIQLEERDSDGAITAEGSVADLQKLHGLGLRLDIDNFDLGGMSAYLADTELPIALQPIGGTALLLRAAEPILVRDLALTVTPLPGLAISLSGNAEWDGENAYADLGWSLAEFDAARWSGHTAMPIALRRLDGQLRLRERYATLLSTLKVGDTDLQVVANVDLHGSELSSANLDLYSPNLHIRDLPSSAETDATERPGDERESSAALDTLINALPRFPVHASLRADLLTGNMTQIEDLSIELEAAQNRVLMRHFDAKYAGGELILRGAADLAHGSPEVSLAGQGIRVPLAALTEDLGLQQEIRGSLSFRGGIAARGATLQELLGNANGRLALATNAVTISGAAYDLLMSNLLAWLVVGAAEKTTTFDCTMAQFDLSDGVARSDSLFIETSRMLATGKATIDLDKQTLDLRIEPRSKSRTFQFPSAVRMRGPLDDPEIRVSPLQTTVDLSAQALLLLPSLTLRLFGIGPDEDAQRPCEPALN